MRGRSFLISGHRGSGKTSLTLRAVEEVWRSALQKSLGWGEPPVRPLLVKVHGPSLLKDRGLPTLPAAPPPPATTPVTPAGAAVAPPALPPPPAQEAKQDDRSHGALVQLTIALYRALAAEAAESFARHVEAAGDAVELAGQLQLELDGAPEPATLRGFWHRLGRIDKGVLWPDDGETARPKQGVREIVALATAAQVYQVVSGKVTYSETRKDDRSDITERTGKVGGQLKDVVNPDPRARGRHARRARDIGKRPHLGGGDRRWDGARDQSRAGVEPDPETDADPDGRLCLHP